MKKAVKLVFLIILLLTVLFAVSCGDKNHMSQHAIAVECRALQRATLSAAQSKI